MMKKTHRTDSAHGAMTLMSQVAKGLPNIPKHIHVREQDRPFLNAILGSRAKDEWSDVDIVVANQLAWTQYEIAKEVSTIEAEGTVVPNDRGTMVTNPRFRAINEHKQSQLALMKTLALHSMANKDPRKETDKRTALLKTKAVLNDLSDSLIAQP